MRALMIFLIGIALPALAWEPGSPAEVQARIDLVLLDPHLPDISGIHLCARLREISPTLPVMVCAGDVEPAEVKSEFIQLYRADASAKPAGEKATSGRPIDWWYDTDAGVLYTLVVDAR